MSGEIPDLEIERALIEMRAFGEIQGIPPGQLDVILGRMKKELQDPIKPPPPPPAP